MIEMVTTSALLVSVGCELLHSFLVSIISTNCCCAMAHCCYLLFWTCLISFGNLHAGIVNSFCHLFMVLLWWSATPFFSLCFGIAAGGFVRLCGELRCCHVHRVACSVVAEAIRGIEDSTRAFCSSDAEWAIGMSRTCV